MANAQETIEFESLTPWTGTFLNLDKPRTVSQSANEKAKFSANFETDKDDPEIQRLRAAIVACARQNWPALDVGAAIKSGALQTSLQDGDKLADKAAKDNETPTHKNYQKNRLREWSRGKSVLVARSEFMPPVTIRENGISIALDGQDAIARSRNKFFYAGVKVLFAVRLNAYDAVGATGLPGVNAYLAQVESLGHGAKLIATRDPTDRFKGYRGSEKNEDPTGGDAGSDW